MDYDVLIVGMGPVGAVAANLAGMHGLKTLVVDKMTAPYDKPRAFGLDQEVMRLFANIGIAGEIAGHVMPYRTSEYHNAAGRVIKRIAPASPPYLLGWAPNYVFSQPAIEGALRANVARFPNVSVELGVEVLALDRRAGGCSARLRMADGGERQVSARYVLACDGGASPLRTSLGLDMEDLQFDEPWMVVDVLVEPDALARLPQTNVQYCETGRPCTFIVGPGNHRRWEFMINPGETPAGIQEPASIRRLVSRWLAPGEYEIWRASAYRFHALVLKTWRDGPLFFLGDAAHMTPPFMAQGMCQGIRDAANLVWKLSMALRGQAADTLLDTYQQERLPHVRQTTLVAKELGQVICERDPAAAAVRDARLLAEMAAGGDTIVRQSLIPGLAGGLLAGSGPHSVRGVLFPQPRVRSAAGVAGLLDEFTGMQFRLVAAPGASLAPLLPDIAEWRGGAAFPLVTVELAGGDEPVENQLREQDGVLAAWMARHDCQFVLVRPDHYVFGGAASVAEAGGLLAALRGMLAAGAGEPALA